MRGSLPQYRKTAYLLIAVLALLIIGSFVWIFYLTQYKARKSGSITADIYQDGALLQSIPLDKVEESYTFIITNENGSRNEIEVCPGSVRILSANCPDKLCVQQGYISTSLIPITCLPNHLVIQIREEKTSGNPNSTMGNDIPDAVTY